MLSTIMHIPLKLPQNKTAEFIKIYNQVFGIVLSTEEANAEVYRLLSLISLFTEES